MPLNLYIKKANNCLTPILFSCCNFKNIKHYKMKKIILTSLSILACVAMSWAQEISVGTASIAKVDRPCIIAAYTMPSDIVSEALADKLKQSNIKKGSKVKGGFRVFKGVSIPSISDDKLDLYTRVTGKKENSTLYMAVSRGYDNFISPEGDAETLEKAKAFVQSMLSNVNVALIKTDIAAQAKVLSKAEKIQKTKSKKGESLKSEMKSLESKLEANKKNQEANVKDQEAADAKVKEEAATLSELKAKLEMMIKK
jgi:hypothetical protein